MDERASFSHLCTSSTETILSRPDNPTEGAAMDRMNRNQAWHVHNFEKTKQWGSCIWRLAISHVSDIAYVLPFIDMTLSAPRFSAAAVAAFIPKLSKLAVFTRKSLLFFPPHICWNTYDFHPSYICHTHLSLLASAAERDCLCLSRRASWDH